MHIGKIAFYETIFCNLRHTECSEDCFILTLVRLRSSQWIEENQALIMGLGPAPVILIAKSELPWEQEHSLMCI